MISQKKKIISIALFVIMASVIAIGSKIMLPSEVNAEDFDSLFVRVLGFEVVASLYFIMIYAHNAVITLFFGQKSELPNNQAGLRFGICFALIYLFGMQEVVVEASPFTSWGTDFIIYQFFMGAGEAIAAVLLCTMIAKFVMAKKNSQQRNTLLSFRQKVLAVLLIAAAFTAVRIIGYEAGIMHSNANTLPIPTYLWTAIFGIVLGVCHAVLYPIFKSGENAVNQSVKIMILSVGLCWILFNLFIGLIFAGAMTDMLLRSGLDVLAVFLASVIWGKYIRRPNINSDSIN